MVFKFFQADLNGRGNVFVRCDDEKEDKGSVLEEDSIRQKLLIPPCLK